MQRDNKGKFNHEKKKNDVNINPRKLCSKGIVNSTKCIGTKGLTISSSWNGLRREKKKSNPLALVCFKPNNVEVPPNSWWLDIGATIHVTNYL